MFILKVGYRVGGALVSIISSKHYASEWYHVSCVRCVMLLIIMLYSTETEIVWDGLAAAGLTYIQDTIDGKKKIGRRKNEQQEREGCVLCDANEITTINTKNTIDNTIHAIYNKTFCCCCLYGRPIQY